ncbi:MAG: hypothetical protein KDB61_13745, partial [Planctomycetes bacterium]|nr:hypothetical protein [Planctomycetota bacterium]
MLRFLPFLLICFLFTGCNLVRMDSRDDPPRIEARGLVRGHAALGILDEDQVFHMDLFYRRSSRGFFDLGIWKLLRVEVGLAGAAVSVGPFHLGLGVLNYRPQVPDMMDMGESHEADECECPEEVDDCWEEFED